MPHFFGRTHSTRDRRVALVGDDPAPRTGPPTAPGAATIAPTGAILMPSVPAARPSAPPVLTRTKPAAPTHEQIATLAYSYWEARGRQAGSPEADWLRAEKELRGR
jgi:hypothetical protein